MCMLKAQEGPLHRLLVGETPQVKPIAIVTYVAIPKDNEWFGQAKEKRALELEASWQNGG